MIKKPLRIIFIGTSSFGLLSLEKIYNSPICKLVGIITLSDKPASRGRKLVSSPIKKWALEKLDKEIPILEPKNLKDPLFLKTLENLKADLQIVVAFRMLPKQVWAMPNLGTFNLHASNLPNYRGSAPINHVLINGEKKTGVTTFMIDKKIDTGNILLQKSIFISETETAGDLHDKLSKLGSDLVIETIEGLLNQDLKSVSQPLNGDFKEAPKLSSEFTRLDWKDSLKNIINKIRGLSPYPGAWTKIYFDESTNLRMKIFSAKKIDSLENIPSFPGKIFIDFSHFKMKIFTFGGYLSIEEAQLEGKEKMPIKQLINGFQKKQPTHVF